MKPLGTVDTSFLLAEDRETPLTILNGRVTGSRRLVAQSWSLQRIKTVAKALDAISSTRAPCPKNHSLR